MRLAVRCCKHAIAFSSKKIGGCCGVLRNETLIRLALLMWSI